MNKKFFRTYRGGLYNIEWWVNLEEIVHVNIESDLSSNGNWHVISILYKNKIEQKIEIGENGIQEFCKALLNENWDGSEEKPKEIKNNTFQNKKHINKNSKQVKLDKHKKEIISLLQNGAKKTVIAKGYNVSLTTLYEWFKENGIDYKKEG